jgi:phosphomannomutase/phosphoglucomutase
VTSEYSEYVLKNLKLHKSGMKVVVDCQNGAASEVAPVLLEKLGVHVYRLHSDPTASYPFEHPDPQKTANLEPLKKLVVEVNADIGIAYDGDADRLGIVDNEGNHIFADRIVALFARDVLARYPGAAVVIDNLSSQVTEDEIIKGTGECVFCDSGHAVVKDALLIKNAVLAGENSGHIFFADTYFGYDDGVYASCRLVELLSREINTLSQLDKAIPRMYSLPEERPPCPSDKKNQIVENLRTDLMQQGYQINVGRIRFPRGWGLVRAASTEDVLSMRFEAATDDDLRQYRSMVWEKLVEIGYHYGVEFKRNN